MGHSRAGRSKTTVPKIMDIKLTDCEAKLAAKTLWDEREDMQSVIEEDQEDVPDDMEEQMVYMAKVNKRNIDNILGKLFEEMDERQVKTVKGE